MFKNSTMKIQKIVDDTQLMRRTKRKRNSKMHTKMQEKYIPMPESIAFTPTSFGVYADTSERRDIKYAHLVEKI